MNKTFFVAIVFLFSHLSIAADQPVSTIKAARTTMPLKTYSAPPESKMTGTIDLATFNQWGALPIVAENGNFVQFKAPNGQHFWIMSEKVEIARSMDCGNPTPDSSIKVVKNESLASRGMDEACGRRAK